MVDVTLMQALLKAIRTTRPASSATSTSSLGGAGAGLGRRHRLGRVPVVRLTEVFRQAAGSRIIVNAHRINGANARSRAGRRQRLLFRARRGSRDRRTSHPGVGEDPHPRALRLRPDPRHPGALPDEPRRRRRALAQHRAPGGVEPRRRAQVERFGWTFALGDKVMQIENDYDKEVYNGDVGYVDDVDPEGGELEVIFDGRSVTYVFGELDTLVPAYAATIHKSQGSEYPAVVDPGPDPALRDAAAEPALHRRHSRQAAGGSRRPEEGHRDRGSQRFGPATLVEARRMASSSARPLDRRIALKVD